MTTLTSLIRPAAAPAFLLSSGRPTLRGLVVVCLSALVAAGFVLDVAGGGTRGLLTSTAVATFLAVRVIRVAVEVRGLASFGALTGVAAFALSAGAVALAAQRGTQPPHTGKT